MYREKKDLEGMKSGECGHAPPIEGGLRSRHLPNLAGTAGLRLSAMGLGFVTNIVLARVLGVDQYGILSYLIAWVALLSAIGIFGIDRLLVREVSVSSTQKAWGLLRGLLGWSHLTGFLVSVCVVIAGLFLSRFVKGDIGAGLLPALPAAAGFLVCIVMVRIAGSTLQGLHRIVPGQIGENLLQPGLTLVFIAIAGFLLHYKLVTSQILLIYLVSALIAWMFSEWLLWRALPEGVRTASGKYESRRWIACAVPLLLISALDMLNRQTSLLILGAFSGPDALGLYSVADRGAQLVAFPIAVVNLTLAPTFATLYETEDQLGLQRLVTKSARLILATAAPIALLLIFGGHWFLMLFGSSFTGGQTPMTILCLGQLVNSAMGSVGYLLIMTGHGRDAAVGIAVGAGVSLLTGLLLIPMWGVNGAAVASVAGLITWNVVLAVLVWKRIGIMTTAYGRVGRDK
jgi:O-antigen/teichoic acid export membrane protein